MQDPLVVAFMVLSLVLTIVELVARVAGHFDPAARGLNPIINPLSEYAARKNLKKYFTPMFWLGIFSSLFFFLGILIFYIRYSPNLNEPRVILSLTMFGICPVAEFLTWALPLRIKDPGLEGDESEPVKYNHDSRVIDFLHWVFAVIAYASFLVGASNLPRTFYLFPGTYLEQQGKLLSYLAYAGLASIGVMIFFGHWLKVFGLFQRLYTEICTVWYIIISVVVIRDTV
ncbi:hypothetical protein HDU67_001221 [Dinochytrium kinnereticum]|nr:hypothetical protein HDU67_001221 [Dinochytrium kinnereticum]